MFINQNQYFRCFRLFLRETGESSWKITKTGLCKGFWTELLQNTHLTTRTCCFKVLRSPHDKRRDLNSYIMGEKVSKQKRSSIMPLDSLNFSNILQITLIPQVVYIMIENVSKCFYFCLGVKTRNIPKKVLPRVSKKYQGSAIYWYDIVPLIQGLNLINFVNIFVDSFIYKSELLISITSGRQLYIQCNLATRRNWPPRVFVHCPFSYK